MTYEFIYGIRVLILQNYEKHFTIFIVLRWFLARLEFKLSLM